MLRPTLLAVLLVTLAGCGGSSRFVPPTPEAAAYRDALLQIREADQAPRNQYVALQRRYDYRPPDALRLPLARRILAADSANQAALEVLVAARGWPRTSEVGWRAASAAFLVVQHAPLAVQRRHRPALEAAVEADEADPAWLAELTDRIAVREGRPQPYGSQIATDAATGTRRFHPIEDPAGVDARRAAVGLEPLADYARRMNVTYP